MPSKNMLPKGKRRQTVKADYRAARDATREAEEQRKQAEEDALYGTAEGRSSTPETAANREHTFRTTNADRNTRLDQFVTAKLPDLSRSRAQLMIEAGQVQIRSGNIERPERAAYKVQPGDMVIVRGAAQPPPLRAFAEDIPLTVVYEDNDLAVIDKPAGMTVHAGNGASDDARNSGTLVNALLHHFQGKLSSVGGELRPGIVHRLDKDTSGLILVAKNDKAHRALADMFSEHSLMKRYIALVHGNVRKDSGTINLPIGRDPVRRTRMTTRVNSNVITTASHGRPSLRAPEEPDEDSPQRRGQAVREAVTHYEVLERLHTSVGDFTLLDVEIETGRTHQIRVHMQAIGHRIVGDTLYGAPARIRGLEDDSEQELDIEQEPEPKQAPPAKRKPKKKQKAADDTDLDVEAEQAEVPAGPRPTLPRNFLHAARLVLAHPTTGKRLDFEAPLPPELEELLDRLRSLEDVR
ncbi:RluA family pseudouridine synthase [Terriglobus aquaticus]|uniref:RluA family pseudouridine synthase n=1 Tax=Terriglobus aquaticus TaxID=940139 RepID=A0ABW9KMR1_9BACT|nr:RluA family pseudouridine synthase [Terriglobus aquaticus]